MVMKPEVWGAALDDVAEGRPGTSLDTAAAHRNDKLRHDDVHEVAPRPYKGGEDSTKPLLLVPTPAGKPFTQKDAQAWSREEHIVFACGRYEGIDQRVFEDAAHRYRVREVSIGDYVLIGGEVAVLVIAEAITRLIPGVLGNTESHEDDSFSDGLLEGPSYTKPRVWRGLEAPAVLTSGDHAKVEAWRREQSLKRTREVRPELLEQTPLSEDDRFMLDARDVVSTVEVDAAARVVVKQLRRALKKAGYRDPEITLEGTTLTVAGRTALALDEATRAVEKALPPGAYQSGGTVEV